MQDLLKERTVSLSVGIEPSALVEQQAPHGPAIPGKRRGRRVCGASIDFVHDFSDAVAVLLLHNSKCSR